MVGPENHRADGLFRIGSPAATAKSADDRTVLRDPQSHPVWLTIQPEAGVSLERASAPDSSDGAHFAGLSPIPESIVRSG